MNPGIFYSQNIVHNDICLVKIGVIKIGLRMHIEEREQCRAMTRHRPWILGTVHKWCGLHGGGPGVRLPLGEVMVWDSFLGFLGHLLGGVLVCVADVTSTGQSVD